MTDSNDHKQEVTQWGRVRWILEQMEHDEAEVHMDRADHGFKTLPNLSLL